jgi:thiol-disulfide isomerase/thioredoxin
MKKLSRKRKSDFIFWGILLLFTGYLFLTPSGENTRAWLTALTLSSPSNSIEQSNLQVQDDWQLTTTKGDEVWLSEFKNPIFINIWATWCPPCRSELPSIFELQTIYKDKVDFLLVSPDESIEKLKAFAEEKGYTSTFYNANSRTPSNLVTGSYPTTYILDPNKKLVLKSVGAHDWNAQSVHDLLDKLIEEQAAN